MPQIGGIYFDGIYKQILAGRRPFNKEHHTFWHVV